MTDLNQALVDIRSIRRQVAQATEFRGYGPFTLSATALFALVAGVAQSHWLPEPSSHPGQYVALWLTTGILSAALILTQMLTRANRLHSGMADEMIRMAVAQFLPAAIVGALLPFVLLHITQTVFGCSPVSGRLSLASASSPRAVACRGLCFSQAHVPDHRLCLPSPRRHSCSRSCHDVLSLRRWHGARRCHPLPLRKESPLP